MEDTQAAGQEAKAKIQPEIPVNPISPELEEQINETFMYHAPKPGQSARYEWLRSSAKSMALQIARMCPNSRERSLALTHLQECVMFANAAIAINEK
jgi:hypothetical protein